MTLELKLTSIHDNWGGAKMPSYIYVYNGQAGSLRIQVNRLPKLIKCSAKDKLQFLLCGSKSSVQPQQNDIISRRQFWAEAFIQLNSKKIAEQRNSPNPQLKFKLAHDYFNREDEKQGYLNFQIKYIPELFYQGQIPLKHQIKKIKVSKYVPFYKGNVTTTNLFNFLDFLDPQNKDKKFMFQPIQGIYRDRQQFQ